MPFYRSLHRPYPFNSVQFKDSEVMIRRDYGYVREMRVAGLMIGNAYISSTGEFCPLPDDF